MDDRTKYIINCAGSILGKPPPMDPLINHFIDSGDVHSLQILSDGNNFTFSKEIAECPPGQREVHFIKTSPTDVTDANLNQVVVVQTLGSNPLATLLQSVEDVYGPLIASGSTNGKLKEVLRDFENLLSGSLRKGGGGGTLKGIQTPGDEFKYWEDVSQDFQIPTNEQEKGREYFDHVSRIAEPWAKFDQLELNDVKDLLENTFDSLDSLWKDTQYTQERMENLLTLICQAVAKKVQSMLAKLNVWELKFSKIRVKLRDALQICEKWNILMTELTQTHWRKGRKWAGRVNNDSLATLTLRIEEILALRTMHDELLRLLSPEEQQRLRVESAFEPFKGINVFYVNVYTMPQWVKAKENYDSAMRHIENEVANQLRGQLVDETGKNIVHLLREHQKWQGLMSRENIKNALASEREHLLSQLIVRLERMQEQFESKSNQRVESIPSLDKPVSELNMSPVVASILWAHQLSEKSVQMQNSAKLLLSDLGSIDRLDSVATNLIRSLKEYSANQLNRWIAETDKALSNPNDPVALESTGKLMELDLADGFLKVKFSDRLIQLNKDVKTLLAYSCKLPQNIIKVAVEGKKFIKEGTSLIKVANFFNSMSSQIIESQRPMMLDQAIRFEEVVQNTRSLEKGRVTWQDADEIVDYVSSIQKAANSLMGENRRLRKAHIDITEKIAEMRNIDLLRYRQLWKEKLDIVRRAVSEVTDGKDPESCVQWRAHLDKELFKALEVQYKTGLENLSENLPDIKADITFTNKQLTFRPPLEELKSRYFREIKMFISIPINFQGIGGNPDIYRKIPDKNSDALVVVYKQAEELFGELKALLQTFFGWTVLGMVDMEALIEENLKVTADWERNLTMLKTKRKEADKILENQHVHCFNVSTIPLKNAIEDQLQKLSDLLVSSLKNTVKSDAEQLQTFLNNADEKLKKRPQTVSEIAEANKAALEASNSKGEYQEIYNGLFDKNKLLRQMTGGGTNLSQMQTKWESFENNLQSFGDMIEEQRDVIKKDIERKGEETMGAFKKFESRWAALKPKAMDEFDMATAVETADKMKEWRAEWETLQEQMQQLKDECEHFNVPMLQFDISEIEEELNSQEASWGQFEEFRTALGEIEKEDWLSFRSKLYTFQDFFLEWAEKVKGNARNAVSNFIGTQIENYRKGWPLMKLITGEGFEKEHWMTLFHHLKLPKEMTVDKLTAGDFTKNIEALVASTEQIKELQARAQGEVTIREAIHELRVWCAETEFSLFEHTQNKRTTPLIKDWKDLLTMVSDNQALLASLKESRFFPRFADQVEQFESKLFGLDDHLGKLQLIQRKWVYLEPIFGRGALPQEQARFNRVDGDYRKIMLDIGADPKVMTICNVIGLKDLLDMILDQLERCQRALNDFLEEKRSKFPRFYFIGDDDLLEILGQSKNPNVIQSHLKKLFAGIAKVQFEGSKITAMLSSAGEAVALENPVTVTEEVESWLNDLSREMVNTLSASLKKCMQNWSLQNDSSAMQCLAEQITFSQKCGQSIRGGSLLSLRQELNEKLAKYTGTPESDPLIQSKIKSLVLDLIHNNEVVDLLLEIQINSPNDWEWSKQLKYSMGPDHNAQISMCDAQFKYTYEYQGNAAKLVHTPLTDKCYLTLTQGMMMGYGGCPYGPAGTGKTESVKALGNAFGRQVLVFNCDEGIDFKSMGRIFIGIVKCGAWGCFDEFNRLLEEQLSAISQQIQVIQWAIKNKEQRLDLLERNIDVNHNAGIFVTMNPAGKGYGGRQKLPDNLKALFRPVAMSIPDNENIAEVLLFAEGFKNAKQLAKKSVSIYTLSKQLLSPQQHYDWNLRALKTTLTIAGQILQQTRMAVSNITPDMEAVIIIKAIRTNTLPKLAHSDLNKFIPLISDVFPDVAIEDVEYATLSEAIKTSLQEQKLEYSDKQVSKMLQFHEQTQQRMGIVLVGPSGCGKSTIWKTIKMAYEKLGETVETHVMNPKSMPRHQLLGNMDHDTREWTDGVLTAAARECVKQPVETKCWIVCDGDIDPEWIESLNSVLDDNHLLTMPTGERLNFGDNVNFIFETNDLRFASPATVSRMGMIFMSEEDVDVDRVIKSWLSKHDEAQQSKLAPLIEDYLGLALNWAFKNTDKMVVGTTKVGIVMSALSTLSNVETKSEFAFNLVKGLGGNFSSETRAQFATELMSNMREAPVDPRKPLNSYCTSEGAIKGFMTESDSFKVADFYDEMKPPVVQTIGIQRDMELIRNWLENGDPFIIVGPEGCGKSLMLRESFSKLRSTYVATFNCNAQTTAENVLQKLISICAQSTSAHGRTLRPKDTQRIILYLKDINLPKPDKYNTIQLIALLQQLVTYKGFYDENLDFTSLERIQIVASMNPSTTVGRHVLNPRFTANVRIAVVDYPARDELVHVYTMFLKTILQQEILGRQSGQAERLAPAMVDLYLQVNQKFSIDDHRHYLFTPRDVTQWLFGLMRYEAPSQQELMEVWGYEAQRVFKDRLVGQEHNAQFDNMLYSLLGMQLGFNEKIKASFTTWTGNKAEGSSSTSLGRVAREDLENLISQGLLAYEREYRDMKFHMFDESIASLVTVNRILSKPGGCLLLVGESGVGRRNAATLVTHMLNMEFFTPKITRDYEIKEFKRDLKQVLQTAGIDGNPIVLFMEDYQIIAPYFLELINSLLSSGEIPGLYTHEEIDPLLNPLADEMRQEGKYRTLFEFFVARVQSNLRIILSLDHSHPMYGYYCASNPALYTHCNIVWMEAWSAASMRTVASIELKEILSNIKNKDEITELALIIHNSMTIKGTQQRAFIDLLKTYAQIYDKKVQSQEGKSSHLRKGLGKLKDAEIMVDELSKKAQKQQQMLAVKQKEADEALKEITQAMEQAADNRAEAEQLQTHLQTENVKINKRKNEVEAELSEVQPIVDSARAAVGNIRPDHLNELKSLKMPPEAVADVVSAVLRLMGNNDNSWNAMKRFLGDRSVISSLVNFDARRISADLRANVKKLVQKKSSSFEEASIRRASLAAAPMATWIMAMLQYSEILERIKPLEDDLNNATKILESSVHRLQQCEKQLAVSDKQIADLKQNFSGRTSEAEALKVELRAAEETLGGAQELLGKLSGEKQRWSSQLSEMDHALDMMPRDSMVAAGFANYLTAYSEDIREVFMRDWKNSARQANFDYLNFMTTESKLLKWKNEGLPGDSLSLENAISMFNNCNTSLIIDPSMQASEWLQAHLMQKGSVEAMNQQDPKFTTQLELSVRFGKTLIINEIDKVEPILVPLLRLDLNRQGPRWVVQVGEKPMDYQDTFKLFLTTRDSSIELPPNMTSIISLVNFTVTRNGLEGQLLSQIINFEQPELESQKTKLLQQEESLKVELSVIEKQLLEELASSTGNILENKGLIESLNKTKSKSITIEESLNQSHELQQSLDSQREQYRSVAYRGSIIFMLIQKIKKVNHMYQFSLNSFLKLFTRALTNQKPTDNMQQKLEDLAKDLSKLVFLNVSRSLFKADRLMFGLYFVRKLKQEPIEQNEWKFLKGEVVSSGDAGQFPNWAAADRKDEFSMLAATLPRVVNACNLNDASTWQPWSNAIQCDLEMPAVAKQNLTPFQRLLLIKALRPDRLESAMTLFLMEAMGNRNLQPPPLSFSQLLREETTNTEPILFMVSPGSDPTKELEEFAETEVGRSKFFQMAMGGGQNAEALKMLKECAHRGDWICLKNLHLVTSWLPVFEKELKMLEPHDNFRLWLTTEPHAKFPAILLQLSLKVSYESPPGIKKNMLRTFQSWAPQYLESGDEKRSRILFILAWFHALVQERRTFIPQGWSKFYEFSTPDLRAAATIIEQIVEKQFQWKTIHGIVENALYGGRVDNDFDLNVLKVYLRKFFSDETIGSQQEIMRGVTLPAQAKYKDFVELINRLPDSDSPDIFGLPNNIDRSVQRYNSANVINSLKTLSAASAEQMKFNKEEWSAKLGPLWNLWQTLYRPGDNIKVTKDMLESVNPLDSFVNQEAFSSAELVSLVHLSLEGISKVIAGSGLMTSQIQEDSFALMRGAVPDSWTYMWEGPDSPILWVRGLIARNNALKTWVQNLKKKSLFSEALSLGDLFHPGTFLNALRQMTSRKLRQPMETISLACSFDSQIANGIQIRGLLLQGCSFDGARLTEATENMSELSPLPVCCIGWVHGDAGQGIKIPVYHSLNREKLLCTLSLPFSGNQNDKIISGVAIFLTGEI